MRQFASVKKQEGFINEERVEKVTGSCMLRSSYVSGGERMRGKSGKEDDQNRSQPVYQHPTHIALTAFQDYINDKLGDKYVVEVYPSELLGSQTDMVQLTQTGAIDFCVASNAILETFSKNYEIFNLPYLFASPEAYHHVMDDPEVTGPIYESTKKQDLLR